MAVKKNKKVDPDLLGANVWLDNPEKGLSLIASLLAKPEEDAQAAPGLDEMIGACGRLSSEDAEKAFADLGQIIRLFKLPARNRLLRDTAIVGFGGGFSSGKSSVLNSLLGNGASFKLPVSSNPTTSISTYIMQGSEERAIACSTNGREVRLDPAGLEAISHQFRARHGISLAQYIEFVGLSLPQFPCPGLSLLDTPGYNKADTATQQQHHDKIRSINALSSVDHLVWVIDGSQPLLTVTDADFIKALDLSGEITVILNKCDIFGDIYNSANPDRHDRVASVRQSLEKQNVPYASIIPYSANEPDWNDGRSKIITFLQKVAKGKKSGHERLAQAKELTSHFAKQFKEELASFKCDDSAAIDASLDRSKNPLELGALAQMRGLIGFERASLVNDSRIFDLSAQKLQKWLQSQMEASGA